MTSPPTFIGGPTGPGQAAPGPGGYVIAVVVADVVASLLLGAIVLTDAVTPPLTGVMIAVVYVCIFSIPFALVGVAVVHLLCRHSRHQLLHVLVAGATGCIAAVVSNLVLFGGNANALYPVLPAASAFGRAALVPAVRRAREPGAGA